MPEFNLGRIKGDTGPKGDTGAQGERGIAGEQGPKGDKGDDGYTPVFTVGKVETLAPGENALVEIDSSDTHNPVISFFIPKGTDGRDEGGDMESAIYDADGRKTDVYKYADELYSQCIKERGGTLSGILFSSGGSAAQLCVRNICVAENLPDDAHIGDICLLKQKGTDLTIGSLSVGSTIGIYENGEKAAYIIAGRDYHKNGTVTLVRKNVYIKTRFSEGENYSYVLSYPDSYLENYYLKLLGNFLPSLIKPVELEKGHMRSVFLPSEKELGEMTFFTENGLAAQSDSGEKNGYWTRSRYGTTQRMYSVSSGGELSSDPTSYTRGIRPMLVLDDSACVKSVDNTDFLYEIAESEKGLFIRSESAWERVRLS